MSSAATLFAAHGYSRVSLEDLGAAAGISGPALYRHFESKQALLAAILTDESEALLAGGRAVVARELPAADTLRELVAFHVDWALGKADVIRVQDRDLDSLDDRSQHRVRSAQRTYVELWVGVLAQLHAGVADTELRARSHAVFGLLNSTPYSGGRSRSTRELLTILALAALRA